MALPRHQGGSTHTPPQNNEASDRPMSQIDAGAKKSSPTNTSESSDTTTDAIPPVSEFSQFRIDCLTAIGMADSPPKGLAVKDALTEYYGKEVNHGRLYPNLDWLAAHDLVEKRMRDRRTNEYELTARGAAALEQRKLRLQQAVTPDESRDDEEEPADA